MLIEVNISNILFLANALSDLGDEAIKDYTKAITLNPHEANAYYY